MEQQTESPVPSGEKRLFPRWLAILIGLSLIAILLTCVLEPLYRIVTLPDPIVVTWSPAELALYETYLAQETAYVSGTLAITAPSGHSDQDDALSAEDPIAYVFENYGHVRVALINPAGGEPHIITRERALEYHPIWSPDGEWLAIGSSYYSNTFRTGVAAFNLQDLSLRIISPRTEAAGYDRLRWSPDGEHFAYWCDLALICIADPFDGSIQRIAIHPEGHFWNTLIWSPTAEEIAYICEAEQSDGICVMDIETRGAESFSSRFVNSEIDPLWSANGAALIYASSQDPTRPARTTHADNIYSLNVATGEVELLLAGQPGEYLQELTFSHDQQWIAFVSGPGRAASLWVLAANGNSVHLVADNLDTGSRGIGAIWSPVENKLLFVGNNSEVYWADAAGGNPVNLTNHAATDDSPAWSPDGTRIAFISDRDGQRELYVMNADGSGLMRLTNSPEDEFSPVWGP